MSGSDDGGISGVLSVNTDGVIDSAAEIEQVAMALRAEFEKLRAEGDAVIKGSWTGAAADKLDDGWQEWQAGIHKITAALDQATRLVAAAANTFRRLDEN